MRGGSPVGEEYSGTGLGTLPDRMTRDGWVRGEACADPAAKEGGLYRLKAKLWR